MLTIMKRTGTVLNLIYMKVQFAVVRKWTKKEEHGYCIE
jgi:hypothetical protein